MVGNVRDMKPSRFPKNEWCHLSVLKKTTSTILNSLGYKAGSQLILFLLVNGSISCHWKHIYLQKKKKKMYLFRLCVYNGLNLMGSQGLVSEGKKRMNVFGVSVVCQVLYIWDLIQFSQLPTKVFPSFYRYRGNRAAKRSHIVWLVSGDDSMGTQFCMAHLFSHCIILPLKLSAMHTNTSWLGSFILTMNRHKGPRDSAGLNLDKAIQFSWHKQTLTYLEYIL